MIKKYKWQLIISSVIILMPIVAGVLMWNYLPEQLAAHWGVGGDPDRWSSRGFAIFGMPLIFLAVHWICIFFTVRDPKNKDQSSKVLGMVFWILPIVSLIVCGFIYAIVLGIEVNSTVMVRALLGVMFAVLGNYMPKCKQNHTIGVKVIWALRNEENWNRTHRFTGKLWVCGGLLLLATLSVPTENIMYVVLLLILFMAFVPVIYSYVYYRKQLKAGTATKEDAAPYVSTKVASVIGIVILVFAAVFLFIGKFEVEFHDTSFTIEANSWKNATVNYADIDNIEYREQTSPGTRTFGYGTPFIVMGECKDSEFGSHTRYTYKSCDAGVVLTVNDKILVINGKDRERTKVIYDELIDRMSK